MLLLSPAAALTTAGLQKSGRWPKNASGYRMHMIGHAHIDPVWLWPWPEGVAVTYSTFRSALDRMNETPDFRFTASSAQFYQWISENDPGMLKEIRKRVDEGRWDIAGGWWVEPDMNIPSGEAMVRQGLYGQLTFEKLLGKRATVATNPDSFGHTGTLPQIIKGQGMENYVFMRPGIREKTIPADLFWWEGPDGTRVLTYRIPISYNDSGSVRKRVEDVLAQFSGQPMTSFMVYYGVGDHGGGATRENIQSISELMAEKGAPVVMYSTTDRYFEEIRRDKALAIPVIKDDLQHHAVGCYTAESEIKKGNRHSEAALVTAEKICAIGSAAWGANYPKDEFTAAWHKVLFLQFHDSLAGTSVPEHSLHAREGYGYAMETSRRAYYMAVQKLESLVPAGDPGSKYLLALNTHAWDVNAELEYDLGWTDAGTSRAEDESGKGLLHQWIAPSTETSNRSRILARVPLPPFGYRQVRVRTSAAEPVINPVTAEERKLENEFLKITFSGNGTLSIFDKEHGKELFTGGMTGCRPIVINDPSDTWSHNVVTFADETGSFGNASFRVLEKGPLRGRIRVRSTWGSSMLAVDWMLSAGSRNPVAEVRLDWKEQLKMLKFSFPIDIESPVSTYESAYGSIERECNGHEEPGQRWLDVTGISDGMTYGLTVINDAKYGYSVPGSDLRISVARSAVYAHHDPRKLDMEAEHIWQDQGIQTFRMMLVPHAGTWKEANIPRIAEEFMAPPVSIYQGIHGGTMPKSGSFLSVDKDNIVISSVKLSEKDDDMIIRCVETQGDASDAVIDLSFAGRKWSGSFRSYEIKTLRLNRKTGEVREVNLLEE